MATSVSSSATTSGPSNIARHSDQLRIPVPQPGVLWGFNLVRVYRGADGNNTHQPDEFGLLLFE